MVKDLTGPQVMGIEWSLLILAGFLVALRLNVRLRLQRLSLLLSDILLIVSVVDGIALIICDTQSYRLGAMGGSSFSNEDMGDAALAQQVILSKYSFASNYFYDSGIYFPKFTILAFYLNLFPKTMPWLRTALYMVGIYTICAFLCTIFLDTFWCGSNIASNWSPDPDACSTFNSVVVFQVDWATQISSDLMIFFLPFPLLRKLQLKTRQIVGLCVTFGLGFITMAVSISRFASVLTTNLYNTLYVWSMAELAVAIIVVCLPSLSVLLYRRGSNPSSIGKGTGAQSHYTNGSKTGRQSTYHKSFVTTSRPKPRNLALDDGDSDIELNPAGMIFKSEQVDVESQSITGLESRAESRNGEWSIGSKPRHQVRYSVSAWAGKDS